MLELHAVDRQGKRRLFDYDPYTPRLMPQGGQAFKPVKELPPAPDLTRITNIRIALGKACNMRCVYCSQRHSQYAPFSGAQLDKLAADLAAVMGVRGAQEARAGISLWGGEPLLYFELIKYLTAALQKQNWQGREIDFYMTSNGNLITPEITGFLIAHDVRYSLSHDGPGQRLRGLDPWSDESKRACLQKLYRHRPFTFSCVMTSANSPAQTLLQHLQNMTQDQNVQIGEARPLTPYSSRGAASMARPGNLKKHTAEVLSCLLQDGEKNFEGWRSHICEFMMQLSGWDPLLGASVCHSDKFSTLTVDLHGHILTCQNFEAKQLTPRGQPHAYAHLRDLLDSTHFPEPPQAVRWNNRGDASCHNCPVLTFCRGGCPYNEPAWHEAECRSVYAHYMAFLAYSVYKITGCLLTNIEGDFKFGQTQQLNLQTEVR
jgi:uncharacterized protein